MIKFLKRRQIDIDRWNRVISSSEYETVYPYSWYLDACADNWGAFIMNDYECIMPVVYRYKMGFKYTYQPRFCQQLGVYSEKHIDIEVLRMFLNALSKRFKMGDYSFNEGNLLGDDEPGFDVLDNMNYILDIHRSYDDVAGGFTQNCKRNISRSYKSGMEFTDEITIEDIVCLKKGKDLVKHPDKHYVFLIKMFTALQEKGKVKVFGAKIGSHLCAAAVFAYAEKRVHYLLSFSNDIGKEKRAMFMVIDSFIQKHASEKLTLDFEGSNVPSIARFFRGFGAKPQVYQRAGFQNKVFIIIKKLKGV